MAEWGWLRMSLYAVLAFSLVMWMVTMGWDHSNELVDVVRIEAAKIRYLITIAVCLAGLAASSAGRPGKWAVAMTPRGELREIELGNCKPSPTGS